MIVVMLVAYSHRLTCSSGRCYSGTATKAMITVRRLARENTVKAAYQGHSSVSSIRVSRKMPQLLPNRPKVTHKRMMKAS